MSKIRALNEDASASESDDEANRKLSKEAQEELAKLKYNQGLKTLAGGHITEAAELFEKLLTDPCLCPISDDLKQFTPSQQQLQLGCLKILGDLYRDGECQDLERAKYMYERAIYLDQDDNINLWYRLGKVSFEAGDLYMAHNAFAYALRLRPSHWGCLERMVTVSYALQDYTGCLKYCAVGLAKDAGFIKGLVFRDLMYRVLPELKDYAREQIKEFEALTSSCSYEESWKEKYLQELKWIQGRTEKRISLFNQKSESSSPSVQFDLKSWSIVEVLKEIVALYENLKDTSSFHMPVELTWKVQDCSSFEAVDEVSKPMTTEESQTEEESQSGIRRSRSSSDDKENNSITLGVPNQETNNDKKLTENSENSQPLDTQTQCTDGDAANKKKNKRDVKWWQMEGKRRSQRVRGHLIPVSPDKAKKESSFADQLKNLIPAPLLGDDGSISERESAKASEKSSWRKKVNSVKYFGTKEEETHVKRLLNNLNKLNVSTMIIRTIHFLTNEIKCPWELDLRELFLSIYKYYRSHITLPDVQSFDFRQIVKYAFAALTFLEIITEKYKIELSSRETSFLELVENELFFIDECLTLDQTMPNDFNLRIKWFSVRRFLQMTSASNDEVASRDVSSLLAAMEAQLRNNPVVVWTVNENSNLICLESICEKSAGIAKIQNSQLVTDLYQSQQYESLIGVLKSCINFADIEKRDLSDILYYSVSLFKTGNPGCIHQCLNLLNQSMRFQDDIILSESLVLLKDIWENMKTQFNIQDKRSTVGSLLKILVSCERKPPTQESVLSLPWCILHSLLFSMEREEPAFYLEEDTVPNSILLLQMAHECMSRSEKCSVDNGNLLIYVMKTVLQVKKIDEYFGYEETRHCMEQAIFCLYSHPNKKSKVKNLKDHNATSVPLTWEMCPLLFQYYCPDEQPEFDSYGTIGADVEVLYQRLLEIMPNELKPHERQTQIQSAIEKCKPLEDLSIYEPFPLDFLDIYYLIGDYYFKTKEWSKAVTYYTLDLAISPSRFDSWAAIALCLGEKINTTLNTSDNIDFKDLLSEAQSTAHCFRNALKLEPSNMKLRIEFGSFVYAMHAYCSRLTKHQADEMDMDLFNVIQTAQEDFLQSSYKCFAPMLSKNNSDTNDFIETVEDELWIHHYMLGKIYEKMMFFDNAKEFLSQYELAGKLLHDQGAPYPSKMNYYSPPELAIEALEVYYRIHATILNLVEKSEYTPATEAFYLECILRQENGPFIKYKQSKGEGEGKKGKKGYDEKKEMAEIALLLNDLIIETEKLLQQPVPNGPSESSSSSASVSDEDSSSDSVKSLEASKPAMNSFSLSEFRKRLQEKEMREEKLATEAKKQEKQSPPPPPSPPPNPEKMYEILQLDTNHFYSDFKGVKFGAVIAMCLKAMEECISRYPSHFKSYNRLAYSYVTFLKDAKTAKEYLMGSPNLTKRKIVGLFGERKSTNFFNGIWRNPIDDIDRPGSFSYHMNKTMQLLLDVLTQLNDQQALAEVVVQLARVPDNEKKYLSNPDREQFSQQALSSCTMAVKKKQLEPNVNFHDLGVEVIETYSKIQKHYPRFNPLANAIHDIYKSHLKFTGVSDDAATIEHAIRYFNLHVMALRANAKPAANKSANFSQSLLGDQQKIDGTTFRKRGRRSARQASQEIAVLPSTQDLEAYNAIAAAFQARNMLDVQNQVCSVANFVCPPGTGSLYPTMNIDAVQSAINPLFSLKNIEILNKSTLVNPPPAHATTHTAITSTASLHKPYVPIASNKPPPLPTKRGAPTNSHSSNDFGSEYQLMTFPSTKLSSEPKLAKSKLQLPKKSTNQVPSNVSKYPPMPPLHPIRINTSPFKAQRTAVEQPPGFSYQKSNSSVSIQSGGGNKPPMAHHNASVKSQGIPTIVADEVDVVEVIDLTVKTPEKDQPRASGSVKYSTQAKPSIPTRYTQPQNIRNMPYPLPPKKKHQQMFRDTPAPMNNLDGRDDVEVILLE